MTKIRFQRLVIRAGLIACGVILFGMIFGTLRTVISRHHNTVWGEKVQHGWTFVCRSDGASRPAEESNAFVAFIQSVSGRPEESQSAYWPQYPALKLIAPKRESRRDSTTSPSVVTADGVSSTGDYFRLGVENPDANNQGQDVYVRLPMVPTTYQWVDVHVSDDKGHRAMWRIFDLPLLEHHDLGPVRAGPIRPIPGVKVEARAYWDPSEETAIDSAEIGPRIKAWPPIFAEIRLHRPIRERALWSIGDSKMTQEWERPANASLDDADNYLTGSRETNYRIMVGFSAPHPRVQHVVAIDTQLVQHDSAEETVTFQDLHISRIGEGWKVNLSPNTTVRTHSGITIRAVPAETPPADKIKKDWIYFHFEIAPYGSITALPDSPLYQRSHHPIAVSGTFDYGDERLQAYPMQSRRKIGSVEGAFHLSSVPADQTLPPLQFVLQQDTILQTLPVHLVLPVTQRKPKTELNPSSEMVQDCCAVED